MRAASATQSRALIGGNGLFVQASEDSVRNLLEQIDALNARLDQFTPELRTRGPRVAPRLLTVEEAGVYIGRTKIAIQQMVAKQQLPVVRHDRRVFLDRNDLDAWIEGGKIHA